MNTVTIVIPCLNEQAYIIRCLESVAAQSYPAALITTLVCDGMSDDGTRELVRTYASGHPQVKLLDNVKRSTPFALNLGIRQSNANILIILGAHSELHPDFVLKSVESFAIHPAIRCTGGVLENVYKNETSQWIGAAMSSAFGVGNAHFRTGNKSGFVDTVAFGAYRRDVFGEVGLFDEELIRNQDDEFNFRVTNAGYKIYLNQEIRCRYFVRASFQKLFRQYYQYGYWKVCVNKKHGTITTLRQLVPMGFVLFLLFWMMSILIHPFLFAGLSCLAGLYLLLALTFAIRSTPSLRAVPGISVTFFILHLSYGLGYLRGIFDFFILRKAIKTQESLSR